eukprot:gene7936-8132_t
MSYDYYASGAETQTSVLDNRTCFAQYRILPRILVDVSKVDTSCCLFGYRSSMPVLVAPMAMHGLAHASKELGTAQGAATACVPMLYVIRDRELVTKWVMQAEAAGYKALVITVDAQRLGRREADERNRFRLPDDLQLVNLLPLADKRQAAGSASSTVAQARQTNNGSGLFELFAKEVDDSLTWDFIPWLRTVTKLPIYIKGVLAPADARLALQYGADGIIVSNHGGRQLDYSPAALDVLPAIVAAVNGRVPVMMDGGIRRGTDVLKALALGASAVLLGRPVLYGLAVGGPTGVTQGLDYSLSQPWTGQGTVQPDAVGPEPSNHQQLQTSAVNAWMSRDSSSSSSMDR